MIDPHALFALLTCGEPGVEAAARRVYEAYAAIAIQEVMLRDALDELQSLVE